MFRHLFGRVFQPDALRFQRQNLCHSVLQRNGNFLTGFCTGHHQNKLSLRSVFCIVRYGFTQGAAAGLLVELGQLPAQGNAAARTATI